MTALVRELRAGGNARNVDRVVGTRSDDVERDETAFGTMGPAHRQLRLRQYLEKRGRIVVLVRIVPRMIEVREKHGRGRTVWQRERERAILGHDRIVPDNGRLGV